jgi:hypothetical protein
MDSSRALEAVFQITLGRQVSFANDKSQHLLSILLLGTMHGQHPQRFILLLASLTLACERVHPRR